MSTLSILIINGPNLNLLGKREQSIYGNQDFVSYFDSLKKLYPKCDLSYFQSNHEGEIIDIIHEATPKHDAIILNAGAYTHTSIAIRDAIAGTRAFVMEVHISNIYQRETFRHHSFISSVCKHSIIGKGLQSYRDAIEGIISPPPTVAVEVIVHGKVQGVWYRYSTQKEAKKLKIVGQVSNLSDGNVLVKAMGSSYNIDTFLSYLATGPEHARVNSLQTSDINVFEMEDFQILR